METLADLLAARCRPRQPETDRLPAERVERLLELLPGWTRAGAGIAKTFRFQDYHRTMAFVNAVAWVAHREDHHPDLEVSYDRCRVYFSTHDTGGLSENDFICAAKVDALLAGGFPAGGQSASCSLA